MSTVLIGSGQCQRSIAIPSGLVNPVTLWLARNFCGVFEFSDEFIFLLIGATQVLTQHPLRRIMVPSPGF